MLHILRTGIGVNGKIGREREADVEREERIWSGSKVCRPTAKETLPTIVLSVYRTKLRCLAFPVCPRTAEERTLTAKRAFCYIRRRSGLNSIRYKFQVSNAWFNRLYTTGGIGEPSNRSLGRLLAFYQNVYQTPKLTPRHIKNFRTIPSTT